MGKVKAIFFDNDGILVDTEYLYFEANRVEYLKYGVELTDDLYVEYFLKKALGTWHLLREKGFSEEKIAEIRKDRNETYLRLLREKSSPIKGVEKVLKQLYGKLIVGVVTSSRKDHFDTIHDRTGFKKYFDFVLTSDDYQKTKPDPEPYLKALEVSGLKSEECIVIEDSERGLKAASAAGIKCYIIPTNLTKGSDFSFAEKVLSSINEIIPIVVD